MKLRIFRNTLIAILCFVIASTGITLNASYKYFNTQLETELGQEAAYAAAGLKLGGADYLDSISEDEIRITWIDKSGKVLYDNRADASEMENHLDREEIKEAVADGHGTAIRNSGTMSVQTVYYALRLDDNTILRVSSNRYTFLTVLKGMIKAILFIFAFALILSALIAFRLSSRIVKPLENIDIDNPDEEEIYDELRPAVRRLKSQNQKILSQIDELKLQQAQLNATMESMSEGMIITNTKAEILSCNHSALRLLGFTGEGSPFHVLDLSKDDRFRYAVLSALEGKRSSCTMHIGDTYCEVIAAPVIHEGEKEGLVIMVIDETEKEKRDVLRREFTSNVSHELKTPLTSISGFAELIKNGLADEDTAVRFSDNIYREAQRLITLVNDIIRLSQLDGGEIPYDKEPVDQVASEVVSRLAPVAEKSDITLTLSGKSCYVDGNRRILDEIISNLCDNAIKYNSPGGHAQVIISDRQLTVRDDGIGIPSDQQSRIFERFYRVDKSHSKEVGGTGLGLSIVKHGAIYHNAVIHIDSAPGKGTSISLEFK
mgnify:FL=1